MEKMDKWMDGWLEGQKHLDHAFPQHVHRGHREI